MASSENKQVGTARKLVASDLSTEISYFAWKRGPESRQPLAYARQNSARTA